MRNIVAGLFVSLDGVIEGTEGWQFAYFNPEVTAAMDAGARSAGALLLGRRTYEEFEALREVSPEAQPVALMDALPIHVVSSTLNSNPRVTVLRGDLKPRVERLREEGEGDLLTLGSPTLVCWLLSQGLLSELRLLVMPIVVGSGLRLFDRLHSTPHPLALRHWQAMSSGVLNLHYAPAAA